MSLTALALCALLAAQGAAGPLLAQQRGPLYAHERTSAGAGGLSPRMSQIRSKAGGYGWMTPLVVATTKVLEGVAREAQGGRDFTAGEAFDFAAEPKFWGGLAGDFVFTAVLTGLAGALPGGSFLKMLLPIGGGFVGWEVGSGNLRNTNWMALGGQIMAVAAIQYAVLSMGGAPMVAAVASLAGGIGFGILHDAVMGQPISEAEDFSTGDGGRMWTGTSDPYQANHWTDSRAYASDSLEEGPSQRERIRQVYSDLRDSLKEGRLEDARSLLHEYRRLTK